MSKPGTSKQKYVKTKLSVMGDFFSRPNNKAKKSNKGDKGDSATGESEPRRSSLKRKVTGAGMFGFSWTRGAQKDTEEYRNGYPGKKDHPELDDNYMFYMNKIPSKPDGDFIDKIHEHWWGDYRRLEVHHGYIQWLFPIRETGLNWHAQELQLHEIKKLIIKKEARKRILTSYKMMLDFYGMELLNEDDGQLGRADNWKERFQHLNRSFHNYLRITRILKCLGEFGFEHLKKNFIAFVLKEGLQKGTLDNVIDSCMKYWIGVLKDDQERKEMFDYYEELSNDDTYAYENSRRSPSPSSARRKQKTENNTKTVSKVNKMIDNAKAKQKKEEEKDEFSDLEDDSLYYGMSLIDEDKDVGSKKTRKDHELSDSDADTEVEESQEMEHWRNESNENEESLKNEPNKNGKKASCKPETKEKESKNWNEENMSTDHEIELGSESFHGTSGEFYNDSDDSKSQDNENTENGNSESANQKNENMDSKVQENEVADSAINAMEETNESNDMPIEKNEADINEAKEEKVKSIDQNDSDSTNVDKNKNNVKDNEANTEQMEMETGEENVENVKLVKDLDNPNGNVENNKMQEEVEEKQEEKSSPNNELGDKMDDKVEDEVKDRSVDSVEMGSPDDNRRQTRAQTKAATAKEITGGKTGSKGKSGESTKANEKDSKSDETEAMETNHL